MNKEKLEELKELLDELIGDNEPSNEDLDFDDDAIEMYAAMHDLREAMEECGF